MIALLSEKIAFAFKIESPLPRHIRLDSQHVTVKITELCAAFLNPRIFEEKIIVEGSDLTEVLEPVGLGHLICGLRTFRNENCELVVVDRRVGRDGVTKYHVD
jgi:hypothetical protein